MKSRAPRFIAFTIRSIVASPSSLRSATYYQAPGSSGSPRVLPAPKSCPRVIQVHDQEGVILPFERLRTPASDVTASVWWPSPLSKMRSAFSTSFWSSGIRILLISELMNRVSCALSMRQVHCRTNLGAQNSMAVSHFDVSKGSRENNNGQGCSPLSNVCFFRSVLVYLATEG